MDAATYDKIIVAFYRAATGAVTWESALEILRSALDCRGAEIDTLDLPTKRLLAVHGGGPDIDHCTLEYIREYHAINPRSALQLKVPLGQWVHSHEHLSEEFIADDRFYQEFVPSYDLKYTSAMTFAVDDRTFATLAVIRRHARGPLNADERACLMRLGEHIQEALLAFQRIRQMAAAALAGHKLLAVFPYPMWLLDADRYIYFANPLAQAETDREQRFALNASRLRACRTAVDRALTLQIEALRSAGHLASAVVDLRQASSDPPSWLHLSQLVPGQVLGAFGDRPQILATLFDPRQVSSLDPFALANIFKLTPTEAKVATQIADGLTPDVIAEANGTRLSTVRTQLSHVLAKLGVARQADAVRVLRQGESLWAMAPRARS